MILGIDPSSTCTGYCILDMRGEIRELGRWEPTNRDAEKRLDQMQLLLGQLLNKYSGHGQRFPFAVVEKPAPPFIKRTPEGRAEMAYKGYMEYCFAAGALWTVARLHCKTVHRVSPSMWTHNRSKKQRANLLAQEYPEHEGVILTAGYDAADALGLALWGRGKLKEQEAKDV